jgi:hypothetical protein
MVVKMKIKMEREREKRHSVFQDYILNEMWLEQVWKRGEKSWQTLAEDQRKVMMGLYGKKDLDDYHVTCGVYPVFGFAAETVPKSIKGLVRLSKGPRVEVEPEKLLSAEAVFGQDFTKGTLDRFVTALEDHNSIFEKRRYCGDAETLTEHPSSIVSLSDLTITNYSMK